MIVELAAAASLLGLGRLLDEFATKRLRVGALQLFRSSRRLDWKKFTSYQAWRVYVSLFGKRGSSLRFLFRSLLAYIVIFLFSMIFISEYYGPTYLTVTSIFETGNTEELLGWGAVVIGGAFLYILANAQTLYFLEILTGAPTTFRFFLVAYADILITGSVALFGLPALLTVYTVLAVSGSASTADVTFNFQESVRSPSADFVRSVGTVLDQRALARVVEADQNVFFLTFDYAVNSRNLDVTARDFDLTRGFVEQGLIPEMEFDRRTGVLRVLDQSGSVTGYRERNLAFRDHMATLERLEAGQTVEGQRIRFCRDLSSGREADVPFVHYSLDPEQRRELLSACITQGEASLPISFKLNIDNLDLPGVYLAYVGMNLVDLSYNLFHPLQSYLTSSPYRPLAPRENGFGWWHQHRIGERDGRTLVAMDQTLLSAAFTELGGYNVVLNKSAPAGTINFAIMSTAIFNLIVLGFLFVFYPIAWALRNTRWMGRFLVVRRRPFTYIGSILAVYSLLISAIM